MFPERDPSAKPRALGFDPVIEKKISSRAAV
jgi:hypothetical protein